jgi:hypothetical protein
MSPKFPKVHVSRCLDLNCSIGSVAMISSFLVQQVN